MRLSSVGTYDLCHTPAESRGGPHGKLDMGLSVVAVEAALPTLQARNTALQH